ncbi:hypothetical protein IAT38_002045 [Cryptococcus sp. DSM 104549]
MLTKTTFLARTIQGIAVRPAFNPARSIASTAIVMKKRGEQSAVDGGSNLLPIRDIKRKMPNPFSLFFKDFAANRSNATLLPSGKINIPQLMKDGSNAWAATPDEDKEVYVKKAAVAREEILRERAQYWKSLSPEDRAQLEEGLGEKGARKLSGANRKLMGAKKTALRDREGYPDAPRSAYFAFEKASREELQQAYHRGELDDTAEDGKKLTLRPAVMKEAAKRWRALSEAEKERYQIVAKENREKYAAWVENQRD